MSKSTRTSTFILGALASLAVSGVSLAQTGQTFTAPDQSASATVPAGWRVTSAAQTVIGMEGPGGVKLTLGNTIVAKDAAFRAGQAGPQGVDILMPYASSLDQKLAMLVQQGAAKSGAGVSQFTVVSDTPLPLPAAVGQCARLVASYTTAQGPEKMLAVLCALPVDAGGNYKTIVLSATGPAATAAQQASAASAIFQSYKVPPNWLQRKLAPVGVAVAPMAPHAGATGAGMGSAPAVDNSVNCFDLSVLRQTPERLLPRSCGGGAPG